MAVLGRWSAVLSLLAILWSVLEVFSQTQSDTGMVFTATASVTEAQQEESEHQDGDRNSGPIRSLTGQDAVVETTPAVCSRGVRCGFQVYDQFTRKPIQPFITYCSCPEDTECLRAGENMLQKFIFYKCRGVTEPAEMEIITGPSRETDRTVIPSVTEETPNNAPGEDGAQSSDGIRQSSESTDTTSAD